ncbi:MAG TPA: hypothetical protein DIT11_05630 [Ruminococcaceae bacterium]|nr:hypothetical protein [Oscillospiraceae bacterium]
MSPQLIFLAHFERCTEKFSPNHDVKINLDIHINRTFVLCQYLAYLLSNNLSFVRRHSTKNNHSFSSVVNCDKSF